MLHYFEQILSLKVSPSELSKLLKTNPLNLNSCISQFYRNKYKIFLSLEILISDLLGLGIVMYCDINKIKIEENVIDFYYEILVKNQMKDGELMEYLIKENNELRNKVEIENKFLKQAWYKMCKKVTKDLPNKS